MYAAGRGAPSGGFRASAEYEALAVRLGQRIVAGEYRATSFSKPLEMVMGCLGAGRRQMNVDVAGNVTACISGGSFGNVVTDPIPEIWSRWSAPGARLKRGFFCAHVAEVSGGRGVLDPAATQRTLEDFTSRHDDTLFQRALDVAGPQLAWLLDGCS
jgi:hypothetical protein